MGCGRSQHRSGGGRGWGKIRLSREPDFVGNCVEGSLLVQNSQSLFYQLHQSSPCHSSSPLLLHHRSEAAALMMWQPTLTLLLASNEDVDILLVGGSSLSCPSPTPTMLTTMKTTSVVLLAQMTQILFVSHFHITRSTPSHGTSWYKDLTNYSCLNPIHWSSFSRAWRTQESHHNYDLLNLLPNKTPLLGLETKGNPPPPRCTTHHQTSILLVFLSGIIRTSTSMTNVPCNNILLASLTMLDRRMKLK